MIAATTDMPVYSLLIHLLFVKNPKNSNRGDNLSLGSSDSGAKRENIIVDRAVTHTVL